MDPLSRMHSKSAIGHIMGFSDLIWEQYLRIRTFHFETWEDSGQFTRKIDLIKLIKTKILIYLTSWFLIPNAKYNIFFLQAIKTIYIFENIPLLNFVLRLRLYILEWHKQQQQHCNNTLLYRNIFANRNQ